MNSTTTTGGRAASVTETSVRRAPATFARLGRPQLLMILFAIASVLLLMHLHGQTPWSVSSMSRWFTGRGWIECGSLSFRELARGQCALVGGEAGGPISNGAAFVVMGAVLVRAGLSAAWAYTLTSLVLMSAAFLGAYRLARRVGLNRATAAGSTLVLLSSASLTGLASFGSTFWGIMLVPAFIWVGLVLSELVSRGRWGRRIISLLGWWASALFMLMLDGYGYLMVQLCLGVVFAWSLFADRGERWAWLRILLFCVVNISAFLGYKAVTPGAGEWQRSSIDLFRSMGADLVTLVAPSPAVWWESASPFTVDPSLLWGDGSNSTYNYLGLATIGLAVVGAVAAWKTRRLAAPVAIAGAAALVLALGPSLKINEVRGPLKSPVTYESYLMPPEDAVIETPVTWVYENVPGFDAMRATYRWLALTRMSLLFLAALGVERLFRHARGSGGRVAVITIAVLAVLEVSPDMPQQLRSNVHRAQMAAEFESDVMGEMRQAVLPGQRIVFAPNAKTENDYLANYLAPMLRVYSYNVGGDKALAVARASWPGPIEDLIVDRVPFADGAEAVLRDGYANVVVAPFFDLRWSTTWPTADQFSRPGRQAASAAEGHPGLEVSWYEHFAVISLAEERAVG